MEISLKRNYGYEIIVKADNVNIEEDIEERTYPKDDNGKTDFKKPPKRDISTSAIDMFVRVLEDMILFRDKEYDSTGLIEGLFDKLPSAAAIELAAKLSKNYVPETE